MQIQEPATYSPPRAHGHVTLGMLAERLRASGASLELTGSADAVVEGVSQDSRTSLAGDLFVAIPGHSADGARFIPDAKRAGAVAVVCRPGDDACGLPALLVSDPGRLAGTVASLILGEPSSQLSLVGITGTNGKTSCSYILESIWRAARLSAGVIGTICERCDAFERPASITTPAAVDVQSTLAAMVGAGTDAVAMEVSSHALSQHRAAGCDFDAGIFTNLTRDHLDYHGDEDSYFESKARLFLDYLEPKGGIAVVNFDDARVAGLAARLDRCDVWSYSAGPGTAARVCLAGVVYGLSETRLDLRIDGEAVTVRSRLLGAPNVSNMLAAAACAAAMGIGTETIKAGLESCAPVPGRLEAIGPGAPTVIVDYAHTPDALERVLETLRPLTLGRLVVVFGCGGDRDKGKRPMMGRAAAEAGDVCIVTSDNPRTEEPTAIIADIEEGISGLSREETAETLHGRGSGYLVEPDRRAAIAAGLALASSDDVVLIAGKGHEDYQDVAGTKHPFDDRKVVGALLGID